MAEEKKEAKKKVAVKKKEKPAEPVVPLSTKRAEAHTPKEDPEHVLSVAVYPTTDARAKYLAEAKGEKLLTENPREALAFLEARL